MKFQCKTVVRLLALALGSAGAGEALAVTRYFDCASGNMQTASCWSGNIKPVAGDNAHVGYTSLHSAVTATLTSGSFAAANEFVGNGYGTTYYYKGIVNHSAGSNTVSNGLYVGYHQSGDYDGGYVNEGIYFLSGTASLTTYKTMVGYNSYGEFSQSGGTHTVSTNLSLGVIGSTTGIYSIDGGTLNVNGSMVTGAGYGQLNTNGGTVNVTGSVIAGAGYGELRLYGGTLNITGSITNGTGFSALYIYENNTLNVGGGNGSIDVDTFNLISGTHTLSGSGSINSNSTTIGDGSIGSTGPAVFTQTGGDHTANGLLVAQTGGTGTYTQTAGSNNVGTLLMGDSSGGNGTYNLQGGTLNVGTIDTVNSGTATFNFTGGTLAVGTFIGNLVNNGGILAPGASPGTTVVQGDYTQGAAGALSIELGGMGAGLFDVLQVTGTATLAGDLDVMFWNGFSAAAGDSFDIVSATNLTGNFDTYNLAALGAGLVWDVAYLYDQDVAGTDILRLSVQAVPEPEAYAMMLAGLGLVGWAARRRKQDG